MRNRFNLLILLVLLAFLSICYSLFKGSTLIGSYQLLDALKNQEKDIIHEILFSVRLPRTISAFITGGLLGLSGVLMQILLRNPLADPYVLGISGGAAVGTLLLLFFGITGIEMVMGAWLGSLSAIILVYMLANSQWNSHRILLTGIALASGFSAFISFILIISPEKELRGMLFWLIGDLSYAHSPSLEALILLAGVIISLLLSPQLNILLRGETEAKALGINTRQLQIILYLLSSILAATAVTLAGCIGFVGLIVPHILRLLGLHNQSFLLPASVLLGGTLLTFADTLARTLWSPQQLPVGMMMALIGIPVFLFLLRKNSV